MESRPHLHDYIGRIDDAPDGAPKAGYRVPTATLQSKAACDDHSRDDPVPKERSDAELNRQVSLPLSLEPPPAIRRPPEIKSDSFGFYNLSLFSWNRTEQKDVPACSRSTNRSYTHDATFRFFGFNMSTSFTYKMTDGGIDTAVESVRLGWFSFQTGWVRNRLPKAQAKLEKMGFQQSGVIDVENANASEQDESSAPDTECQNGPTRKAPSSLHPWLHEHYYVVVGYMGNQSVPRESLRRITETDGLFKQIRKAYRHLRNPLRRAMSLKEVSGFGVYQCDPIKGYHKEVELDRDTQRALAELWRSYRSHKLDYGGRWLMWIHEHFNNGSKSPEKGGFALEFKLRWSAYKVIFWGILPVLLSLAVGFRYMYSDHGDVDDVAVAEAAWVIATYIVTTSALLLALLAVITQFGD